MSDKSVNPYKAEADRVAKKYKKDIFGDVIEFFDSNGEFYTKFNKDKKELYNALIYLDMKYGYNPDDVITVIKRIAFSGASICNFYHRCCDVLSFYIRTKSKEFRKDLESKPELVDLIAKSNSSGFISAVWPAVKQAYPELFDGKLSADIYKRASQC